MLYWNLTKVYPFNESLFGLKYSLIIPLTYLNNRHMPKKCLMTVQLEYHADVLLVGYLLDFGQFPPTRSDSKYYRWVISCVRIRC